VLGTSGVRSVSFLPTIIDRELRPEVLRASDPRFAEAVDYLEAVSTGFPHEFIVKGDEVLVAGGTQA
jgi:hypothetical protein